MTAKSLIEYESTAVAAQEVILSSDSHIMEAPDFWATRVPEEYRDRLPTFPPRAEGNQPGGYDPVERLKEMRVDGVSGEVLYPTLGMKLFNLDDPALQEVCFRVSNDWMIEYCRAAPDRLYGISMISLYNIENAVEELERCKKAGLPGAMIWLYPHPDLRFSSDHYERFWAAAQDMDVPVSLHILTGHGYNKRSAERSDLEVYRTSVNTKMWEIMDSLFEIVFTGVLDRYPRLKLVLVENEIGWLPFLLQQWDYYYKRHIGSRPLPIDKLPSEYFYRQVYATFFFDRAGGQALSWWGQDNAMWSSDYPHPNTTWPNSRQVIERDLGHLYPGALTKMVQTNVTKLYNLAVPSPI